MSDTVTVRAVLCADGSEHYLTHDTRYKTATELRAMASGASKRQACGPHYVAERTVVTSEWRRVED